MVKLINVNGNSTRNFTCVQIGGAKGMSLYFSYETIVAFHTFQTGMVICKNIWGTTTGKHLNWLDTDKSTRVCYEDFKAKLDGVLKESGLND